MSPEQARELHTKLMRGAARGIGFFYCGYMIGHRDDETGDEDDEETLVAPSTLAPAPAPEESAPEAEEEPEQEELPYLPFSGANSIPLVMAGVLSAALGVALKLGAHRLGD